MANNGFFLSNIKNEFDKMTVLIAINLINHKFIEYLFIRIRTGGNLHIQN